MSNQAKVKVTGHKMPEHSLLYDRVIPVALVIMGVVMLLLIAFAIGVLTGLIHWA
jgi:hypothetical protein